MYSAILIIFLYGKASTEILPYKFDSLAECQKYANVVQNPQSKSSSVVCLKEAK